ncbi:DUF6495 family protein [Aureisphaera galaxeae]|uniref:DUF6495 family protein n=1 Tax=Aureisphaera galaxeae TaxID=1538023 RepID=UPI002350664F|nr:DUF6495 family protein [Aureisphaera galaxeae]MDC8003744.1 DUF6495 family protein [Aureisphaera galaxeae]
MKYTRLTKEQLEELHQEFINFLATQSITGEEWKKIKKEQPQVAEEEIDVFSDLIWEGVLNKAEYLQNASAKQLFLFKLTTAQMHLIMVKVHVQDVDITTQEGMDWLQNNIQKDGVELFTASKPYGEDRNKDVFGLIQQGASIVDGTLYEAFSKFIGN